MYRIISITTLIVLIGSIAASAQTVVLINGVPTKVNLDGKKIVSIIGPVDGHMKGYPIAATQIDHTTADLEKINGTGVLDETSPATAATSIAESTVGTTQPAVSAPSSASSNLNKPEALAGNYFKFERNSALLSELAINEIKDYADKITKGPASAVTLQAFFRTNSKRSEQLIKNRLDACKKYFELNGVAKNAIQVEMLAKDKQSDKVSVIVQ